VLPDPASVTLNGEGDQPGANTLFLIHPARGGVECFLELARRLDHPITAIRQTEDGESVEALATRYIAAMKTVRPSGPYLLGGYSFGATVCRAMALELERAGELVAGLLLLDEIHRPPTLLSSGKWGERGAILFEIAREYLPPADLGALEAALAAALGARLAARGDADLDGVLSGIGDPVLRKSITEQVRRYEHNVRLAAMYEGPPPRARMTLLRTSNAYHHAPETMAQICSVPGDHFTMLRPPHVDAVVEAVREWLAFVASPPQPAAALSPAPVPFSRAASAPTGHAED
jgi:thioesterase domain-containing protein